MSFLNKRRCKYNKKYFMYTTPKNFGRYKRSNLDIPSKFTNKGTIINGSIGYDGKVTLGIEDNQGTIAYNVGNMTELHLPNLKTSTGTIATGCPKLSVLELPKLEYTKDNTFNTLGQIDTLYLPNMIKWESYGNDRGMFSGSCPNNIIMPNMSNIISGFVNTTAHG